MLCLYHHFGWGQIWYTLRVQKINRKKTIAVLEKGYHALVWREGGWYVARGVEIEVASQGKTRAEAVESLKEALDLLLEDEGRQRIKIPAIQKLELMRFDLPAASYA